MEAAARALVRLESQGLPLANGEHGKVLREGVFYVVSLGVGWGQ